MIGMAVFVIVMFPILSTGTFMNDTLSGNLDKTETFTGIFDGNDQTFDLSLIPKTILSVRVNNGLTTSYPGPSEYSIDDDDVIVSASAFT
jgi:hypothetical protein